MKNVEPVLVLGAQDPEMNRIEELLHENNTPFVHATYEGSRVNSRTAYQASALIPTGLSPVFVETDILGVEPFAVIDHHREGDPGYALGAKHAMRASSLGQVCRLIRFEPTHGDLVLAAMDHNFAAASKGAVPGVTPKELMELKIKEVAKSGNVGTHEVRAIVGDFRCRIRRTRSISLQEGVQPVRDLRELDLGYGYSLSRLAFQVAAVQEDVGVLIAAPDSIGAPEKTELTGYVTPELVNTFMNSWAPSQNLTGIYGVPARGYAGAYRPLHW